MSLARTVAGPAQQRPWKLALASLPLLGVLFFSSYGAANWLAGLRAEVPVVVFEWERGIPSWSWTVFPYWSIDLLYGLSLFVCTTRQELAVHIKRLLAAQAIAIGCFIAFPLRFSFERPATDGLSGWMFEVLAGFDRPFNQAPSLHVVLLVILWVRFARHVPGRMQWILHAWFLLIGASVLTTYQHHFVDIPTGIWVGWLCVWLFPEASPSILSRFALSADPLRRRIAACYALAALSVAAVALGLGGAALFLLWIGGSLLLVALIYLALDESAFQKGANGTMSSASRWLLAPYFLGAWINSRLWTRADNALDAIHPGMFLGRIPAGDELGQSGIRAVVDLTAELPFDSRNRAYHNVPVLDLTLPTQAQLAASVRAIESAMLHGPTLVCCALGYARSALACGAWLLATGRADSVEDALGKLRQARPRVVLGEHHASLLERLATSREMPS